MNLATGREIYVYVFFSYTFTRWHFTHKDNILK